MIATDFISKYRINSGFDLPLKFEKVVEEGIILDVIDVSKVIKAKREHRLQTGIDVKRIFGNLANNAAIFRSSREE